MLKTVPTSNNHTIYRQQQLSIFENRLLPIVQKAIGYWEQLHWVNKNYSVLKPAIMLTAATSFWKQPLVAENNYHCRQQLPIVRNSWSFQSLIYCKHSRRFQNATFLKNFRVLWYVCRQSNNFWNRAVSTARCSQVDEFKYLRVSVSMHFVYVNFCILGRFLNFFHISSSWRVCPLQAEINKNFPSIPKQYTLWSHF